MSGPEPSGLPLPGLLADFRSQATPDSPAPLQPWTVDRPDLG
jgi:hypothetical protein